MEFDLSGVGFSETDDPDSCGGLCEAKYVDSIPEISERDISLFVIVAPGINVNQSRLKFKIGSRFERELPVANIPFVFARIE